MTDAAGGSIAVLSSTEDAPFVARLGADLARSGHRVDDIAGATLHADPSAEPGILRRHLAEAAVALVVLSPAASASEQVRGEIEFAYLAGLAERIVPLIITPTEVPHSLRSAAPVLFTAGDYDAALARLRDRLEALGAKPVANSVYAPPAAAATALPSEQPTLSTTQDEEPLAPATYLPPRPSAMGAAEPEAAFPAADEVVGEGVDEAPTLEALEAMGRDEAIEPASEPPPMAGFPAPITNKWTVARPTAPAPKPPTSEPRATPADAPLPPMAAPTATDLFCRTCGARLRPGYARCGTCGMPVTTAAATAKAAPEPPASSAPDSAPPSAYEAQTAPEALHAPQPGPVFDETTRVAGRLPRTTRSDDAPSSAPAPASPAPERAPISGSLPPLPPTLPLDPAWAAPPLAAAPPVAAPQSPPGLQSAPAPESASEEVAFSAYYPREVAPQEWERLLVYISLAATPILARVEADATARLAGRRDALRSAMAPATTWLPRGTELTLVPALPGYTFNPPSLTVRWEEEAQAHEFRLHAETARPGVAANGSVAIFTGPLLRGEVPLSIFTLAAPGQAAGPREYASMVARAYRRIFASYAHRDNDVVVACERTAEALGDHYLRDVRLLRSGEQWDERLLQAIAEADIFQLFWSKAAALSPAVEREWRHALILQPARGAFIRPVYWTEQPYPPPQELSAIHFARMPKAALGSVAARRGLFARLFRG